MSDSYSSNSSVNDVDSYSSSGITSSFSESTDTDVDDSMTTNSQTTENFTQDDNTSDLTFESPEKISFSKGFKRKKKIMKIFLLCVVPCLCVLLSSLVTICLFFFTKKSGSTLEEEISYKMIFHDTETNEIVEGVIIKDELVRGYSFSDESGSGYIFPLNDEHDEGEKFEFKIESECSCCVECFENDNCVDGKKCSENVCVECLEISDCLEGKVCTQYGRCLDEGSCVNNDGCSEDKICNAEGECVLGCRNDGNCNSGQICDWNGNCMEGCKSDSECRSGEICSNFECSENGCRDNFDCGSYDSVCLDNKCVLINGNSKSCSADNDCSSGDYCDYEYFVCVPDYRARRNTMINRRNVKAAAVCAVYGIISLFVLASSYTIVQNTAQQRMIDECDNQCSEHYYTMAKAKTKSTKVKQERKVKEKDGGGEECIGRCECDRKLVNYLALEKGNEFCPTLELTQIIKAGDIKTKGLPAIDGPITTQTHAFFLTLLQRFCQSHDYTYWYYHLAERNAEFKRRRKTAKCVAAERSIQCKTISTTKER